MKKQNKGREKAASGGQNGKFGAPKERNEKQAVWLMDWLHYVL